MRTVLSRLPLTFFLLAVLPHTGVQGQFHDSSFVRYTYKDGLNHNYITSIEQDGLGYIWVGSGMGINRFDGMTFKDLSRDENFQLPTGNVRRIKKLPSGKLAILSVKGLDILNTKDLSTQHYIIPDSSFFTIYRNAAWDVQVLPDNAIAMTTATGFYVFEQGGKLRYRHDAFNKEDIQKRILYGRDILQVSDKELLIYIHDNALAHYDIGNRSFHEIKAEDRSWDVFQVQTGDKAADHLSGVKVGPDEYLFMYILKDSIAYYDHQRKKLVKSPVPFQSKVEIDWMSRPVAINDSLFVINSSTGGFYSFHLDRSAGAIHFDHEKYLPGHSITLLFADKDKRLWIGTTNGLLCQRIQEKFLKPRYYRPAPGDMTVLGFQGIYRYKDRLYAARFSRTNGLVVIDTASNAVVKYMEFYGRDNPWNEINSIIMYHPDTLWLGTSAGPLWFDTKSYRYGKLFDPVAYPALPEAITHFYPVNKDGYAWFFYFMEGAAVRYHVATRKFRFFVNGTLPAFPFKKVKSIAYDAYGDVWFGGHALARWNSREERFDTLMNVYAGANKFNENILAITGDNKGSLWIHNAENGLLEYRIREKRFIPYTTKDGLPSMVLQCFSPVVNDILWIGTANKLTGFNINTKKSFVYDHHDGFPDMSPTIRRMYYDEERNEMYLLCKNYIVPFPATLRQPAELTGELRIQEFRVNDKRSWYHPEYRLKLRHNENTISVEFNIIEFESPNSYQFSYRIDKEHDWTILGSVRSIQLKGLLPGKHSIQLRAIGKNGEEKLRTLEFSIAKPFWKTTGFLLSLGILLAVMLIWLYRRRLHAIHQKANIDKQLAQTQMMALHAQMNPHFVFNSLNSIREMILNNENKEASHFLSKFAQLMRMTLDHSVRSFISLRSTMEYLERYMEMEQVRNDHFTCRILADEELDPDETLLPPMLIQPFIENAIWHGVTETKKDININIDFIKEGEQLVCIIDDNGMGIERSMANTKAKLETHRSVGIANIRNRVQLLNEKYGLACSLHIVDKSILPGQLNGTKVTIHLPLHINE